MSSARISPYEEVYVVVPGNSPHAGTYKVKAENITIESNRGTPFEFLRFTLEGQLISIDHKDTSAPDTGLKDGEMRL